MSKNASAAGSARFESLWSHTTRVGLPGGRASWVFAACMRLAALCHNWQAPAPCKRNESYDLAARQQLQTSCNTAASKSNTRATTGCGCSQSAAIEQARKGIERCNERVPLTLRKQQKHK